MLTSVLKAKAFGLIKEQAFKAFRAGKEEFVTIRHGIPELLAICEEATHCLLRFQSSAFLEERSRGTRLCRPIPAPNLARRHEEFRR
ncbi:hypothetical protein CJF40_21765 [Pseudomonas lundensis]|uniref:Uncharacterized protein n=1 Tax=Pseudomonas lundensis TaxID=86185 RepID=A0ABX4GI91_9PSED|nr:hypothetical protein CJF40_21765 [Pseudomonas lundensis]OZY53736.1 hypothetical protein CJF38_18530 [Pseudomonas lundensis]